MESLQAVDYMNRHPVTFTTEMPVAEAVERLINYHQTGGPVMDEQRKVVGFLSEQDCLARMIESSYYREQVARVKDIMRPDVLTIKPYESVLELAQQMLNTKPRIYPVVDDDGYLLGTISRSEVLTAIDVQLKSGYRRP
ncbi:CBS domain-containing protein [Aestuariibacter halophilus]|uniref:CBS domain-containing protein n=1 Tax=Fluctibacter halophilus TaxID=226011 RepID=A0ABS8G4J8_9ALTE|nr:CBS domain-containing protein [Aestuariibacter halophilus]MCC2615524.1 CBS domain-containing protein [Aestuariibacter halophilus]